MLVIIVDKSTLYCSKITRKFLYSKKEQIEPEYFSLGPIKFDVADDSWRQAKYDNFLIIKLSLII
jgi:hypothetical protein